ncbi:MAG TPA: DNA repair protein RecO [Chryseosolibacter sp.]|nr:DNA repair protein RecO [Chryseosolibacter sp.]
MIHKTRGIVFRFTRFRETSIIVTIFTDEFGLQSYIVNGVRTKHSKTNKIALFQPLTLLNLVVYHRPQANIERIREVQCLYPFATLTTDMRKSAIAMFLTELLNKTVKEETHAREIFEFILNSLITLDKLNGDFENYHLQFMLRLSHYLGFGVQSVNELVGGRAADEVSEQLLDRLLVSDYSNNIKMSNAQRRGLLDLILDFYLRHFDSMREMKSLQVLRDVMA